MSKGRKILEGFYIFGIILCIIAAEVFAFMLVLKLCGTIETEWLGVCIPLLICLVLIPLTLAAKQLLDLEKE